VQEKESLTAFESLKVHQLISYGGFMNIAAFFDIDGTLFRDSLMIEHFKKLIRYEVIDPALWHTKVKYTYENWKKRRGDYDAYMLQLAEIYQNAVKGMDKSKMEFIISQVIDLKGDTVYMYTRERIEWHKNKGHYVFFISGSPDYLVHRMAEKYGITDSIGTKYLLDDNDRYTGEVIPMWDAVSKLKAMNKIREQYKINYDKSFAYGDTNGDLSMFKTVGNPISINPTRELFESIKNDKSLSDKMKIVVERKDVIYELKTDVTTVKIDLDVD
jgi:HAD superfamily hydrolase (TIGR01490 family)